MLGRRWALFTVALGIIGVVSLGPADAAPDVPSCPSVPVSSTTTAVPANDSAPTAPADVDVSSPGTGASDATVTQTIVVSVLPGPLTLVTERAVIDLDSVDGQVLCGRLPPVRVVDARGSGEGWRVRWSVESLTAEGRRLPPAAIDLVPDPPTVVFGVSSGLYTGGADGADRRVLFGAEPGTGGGTYETGASVEARLPGGRTPPGSARLVVRFALVPRG